MLDHGLARGKVPGPCQRGGFEFLLGSEQLGTPDLAQIQRERVARFTRDFGRGVAGRSFDCFAAAGGLSVKWTRLLSVAVRACNVFHAEHFSF